MTGERRDFHFYLFSSFCAVLTSCGTGSPPKEAAPADKPASSTAAAAPAPSPPFKIKRTQTLDASVSNAWGASQTVFGLGWMGAGKDVKLVAVGKQGTVLVWDLSKGPKPDREIWNSASALTTSIAVGRRTRQIAIGQQDGKIAVADFSKGDTLRTIYITALGASRPIRPNRIAFSADEKSLVVLGLGSDPRDPDDPTPPTVVVCDLATDEVVISAQLDGSLQDFGIGALSTDGGRLINASAWNNSHSLFVRSLPPAIGINKFPATWPTKVYSVTWSGPVSVMALSPDEQIAATGCSAALGKPARIWFHKTESGDSLSGIDIKSGDWLGTLAFSPNGRYLAAGKDSEAKAEIIDVQALRTVAELDGPGRELAWSPDGRRLAASDGHEIKIWEVEE